ncbi:MULTISPECIES: Rap1a/Tai family immunity protein [Aeromonas]|uniref:Rap1a/Tai family immunity protein n=1 Tax=Aeromonas veronii TaxID=654 RepID=UPI0019333A78|nr:Rap1a/Tai family immunity protein [Aeromonas veronii]MBM0416308.1 hypothetical protein [Aeromonas veronii]MBW3788841.1 hypothetical protein [Aeromonas veronii]
MNTVNNLLVGYMLCLGALFPFTASAAFYSGNDLIEVCESTESDPVYFQKSSECRAYIAGVYDSFTGYEFCPPQDVTMGQVVKIAKKYISNNPELTHKQAMVLVLSSLIDAFPCKKNN